MRKLNQMTSQLHKVIIGIVIGCLIMWLFRCEKPQPEVKPVTITEFKVRDSIITQVKTHDVIRTKYIDKYHIIHDSLPCEEVLTLCDTILVKDSVLISALYAVISVDSTIISKQQAIHGMDSITIQDLHRDLRRQKRRTKLATLMAVIGWGVAAVK